MSTRAYSPPMVDTFAAIDFETAGPSRASAVAVGIVVYRNDVQVDELNTYIKPPRGTVWGNTRIHGIRWPAVKDAPRWPAVWWRIEAMLRGVSVMVAHSAFDRTVVAQACAAHGLTAPAFTWIDTAMLARHQLGLKPSTLPAVAARFGIRFEHHNSLEDARACALIYRRLRNLATAAAKRRTRGTSAA